MKWTNERAFFLEIIKEVGVTKAAQLCAMALSSAYQIQGNPEYDMGSLNSRKILRYKIAYDKLGRSVQHSAQMQRLSQYKGVREITKAPPLRETFHKL